MSKHNQPWLDPDLHIPMQCPKCRCIGIFSTVCMVCLDELQAKYQEVLSGMDVRLEESLLDSMEGINYVTE